MKKAARLSFLAAALLGTAWHFLYTALPCSLTALLAPVNESVWEHLKLLYFPPLLVAVVLSFLWRLSQRRFWSGALAGLMLMPLALIAAYYTLTAGFGVEGRPAIDIPLYFAVLALGWYVAGQLMRSGSAKRLLGVLVIAAGVFGAALVVFTIAAPPLPIFIPQ